ncbi:MAG: UDP-N-acetylmuramoyl-L-alanyl-D-glutamate--2,6-diaminopimelate ligase [Candidatus Shapirobacteria bacterium]
MFFQKIKNVFWHLPKSIFFHYYYGQLSNKLTLIGITGTDGKTTTCTLIHQVLQKSGIKSGLITTITSPGLHNTSPKPQEIQRYFKKIISEGCTHCVCEITSHALDQNRFWGCNFAVSAITNISHEHLDYHKNIKNYIASKTKLFLQSNFAVLNRDDQSYEQIKNVITCPIISYSITNPSDFQANNIISDADELRFSVGKTNFSTNSNYHYQIYNILAAFIVTQKLNIDQEIFLETIKKFPDVKGRREEIPNDQKIRTIIDFAHTPNGLKQTLSSLKKITKGKLIVIFGATGGRDKQKRPIMGQVVTQLADITIITADDTRTEKIEDINQQIISGITKKDAIYYNIPNRQDAFNLAIKLAKPLDTVIACGKGHETTILHGKTEYPWSEAEAFRTAIKLKKS